MKAELYRSDRWDKVAFIFSLLGVLGSLGLTALTSASALISLILGNAEGATAFFWSSISFAPLILLGTPALYLSSRAVLGHPPPPTSQFKRFWLVGLLLFPVSLGLGYLSFELNVLFGAFAPIAHFLAAFSPVLIVISLAKTLGPPISLRRTFGHILAGVWGIPPIALIVEVFVLIFVGLIVLGLTSLSAEGQKILETLSQVSPDSPESMESLTQLIAQPGVFITLFAFLSMIVPLLEEAIKSIVIWPLLTRKLTRGEAFLGGVLGGAGFALFESLFLPQPGSEWMATMLGRSGTSFIHGFATGLVCLGIFEWKVHQRWRFLFATYFGAVFLHGLWNASALGIGIESFPEELATYLNLSGSAASLATMSILILILLTIICFAGIAIVSRKLRENGSTDKME